MLRLRTKLLAGYLAALVPLALGFGWWAQSTARTGLEAELGRSLATAAAMVAADFEAGSAAGRIARLEPDSDATRSRLNAELETARAAARLRRIRVVGTDLSTLLDTDPFEPFAEAFELQGDRHAIESVIAEGEPRSSVLFYGEDGTPYMRGYAPLRVDGRAVGLITTEGTAGFFDLLHRFRQRVYLLGLGALLLVVLVTTSMSRRITRPLSDLADAAARIGEGDYATAVPAVRDDEIGTLARALQQMQASLSAREEEAQLMLAGIAHEVRNPLGGMELFVGLLEESLEPDSDAADHAAKVRRELNYLSRVVEEFLLYARERPLQLGRRPARELLDEVSAGATGAGTGGISVEVEVIPDDLEITADQSALRGVLLNLVRNAAQASEPGSVVRLTAELRGGRRLVRVIDQGTGIPADVLDDVFRPFFTTREKGTGLGLPLGRKIVERHGGSLTIDTEPGRGTTVTIDLPFRSGAPPASGPDDSSIVRASGDWDGEMIG